MLTAMLKKSAVLAFTSVALWLAAGSAAVAAPNLSGTWTLVPKASSDVREQIEASLGSGYTQGDVREDSPRVWIRNYLLAQAEKPAEAWVLTIEQSASEFKTGVGDEVRIYYFGRTTTRQGPGGGLRKATVRWEGERAVVEERAEKGSGQIVETYELAPDGRNLKVVWRLEHKSMRQPLELTLAFQKTAP
jgi:hypothetical protein